MSDTHFPCTDALLAVKTRAPGPQGRLPRGKSMFDRLAKGDVGSPVNEPAFTTGSITAPMRPIRWSWTC